MAIWPVGSVTAAGPNLHPRVERVRKPRRSWVAGGSKFSWVGARWSLKCSWPMCRRISWPIYLATKRKSNTRKTKRTPSLCSSYSLSNFPSLSLSLTATQIWTGDKHHHESALLPSFSSVMPPRNSLKWRPNSIQATGLMESVTYTRPHACNVRFSPLVHNH
jgi:hypothetical protein